MSRAEIIRKYRIEAGLSQRNLEEEARLPKKSVHLYETGKREIPTEYLIRIAEILSIPKEELLEKKEFNVFEELVEELRIANLRVLKNYNVEKK